MYPSLLQDLCGAMSIRSWQNEASESHGVAASCVAYVYTFFTLGQLEQKLLLRQTFASVHTLRRPRN